WRRQVINDHGSRSTFSLRTFSGIVDNEGIQMWQWSKTETWKIIVAKGNAPAGQPLQISVLAKMNDCICLKFFSNPEIECKVRGWRRKGRTMINRLRLL